MGAMSDDFDLLVRWQAGEPGAANTLVRRHQSTLEGFFRYKTAPEDVDDLRQQVWLELAKSRPTELRTGFRAYLLGIARHVFYRHCEKKQRAAVWDPLTTSLVDLDLSLSQQVLQALGRRDLRAVLQLLPLDMQMLLEARYLHELTTVELAAMFGVPDGTIKSRLSTARRLLAAKLPAGADFLPQR